MDERQLKKQLKRITAITVISSIALCLAGLGILGYVFRAAHSAEHSQMEIEAQEYKERILKQLDKNTQILVTLAESFKVSGIMFDDALLKESIVETNKANSFISMCYMDKDGVGVINNPGYGTMTDITLQDCNPYAADAIQRAMEGESAISRLFDSEVYQSKIFVYAVPVYSGDELTGVLSASDTIDIFTDIANGKAVMGGDGYVHIINESGQFLVRSENTLVKENIDTIFNGPYLSGDTKARTLDALSNQENIFGEFDYKGEACHFYLASLGLNGWYLFCVNTIWGTVFPFSNVLILFGVVTLLILILVNVLLYSGYHQFRKTNKALLHIAYWDDITGAENSVRFDQNFREICENRTDHSVVALNIHNFKGINDLFGRNRGDKVLRYIKKVIETSLREGEFFCRDSADQFYMLFLDTDKDAICQRLRNLIDHVSRASLEYGEYSYELSLYSGVAVGGDREKALVALQSIQHTHKTDIAFYNKALHDELRRKNSIESQMYPALQNKEFKMFLQPKFDLRTNAITGAEALVRWQNPDGSYRYPGEFIPLFEENGFCLQLDMYMVDKACAQIRDWMDKGIEPIPISVNQSKMLISDLKYPEHLEGTLNKYGVDTSLITLEILERVAIDDLSTLSRQINALHQKGFKISMDDFGSGYSSLNMLYNLNIDELKIDRGFLIKTATTDEKRRRIILEEIIRFAKKLGIVTVAEGIETAEDRDNLLSMRCDCGQGYFFERPMNAADFNKKYMYPPSDRPDGDEDNNGSDDTGGSEGSGSPDNA